jgi:hypothetical protein
MASLEWKVVASIELDEGHSESQTKHVINGTPCLRFARLEVCKSGEDAGFYLMHICTDGRGTDTFHESLNDAIDQAEFEFGVRREDWDIGER